MSKNYSTKVETTNLLLDSMVSLVASALAILISRVSTGPVYNYIFHGLAWAMMGWFFMMVGTYITKSHHVVIRYATLRSTLSIFLALLIKEVLMGATILAGLFSFKSGVSEFVLVALDGFISFTFCILVRVFILLLMDERNEDPGINVDRKAVLIVGTKDKAVSALTRLQRSRRYRVCGLLSFTKSDSKLSIMENDVYYFGEDQDLFNLKRTLGIAAIVLPNDIDVAHMSEGFEYDPFKASLDKLLKACVAHDIQVLNIPYIDELEGDLLNSAAGFSTKAEYKDVDEDYIPDNMGSITRNVKRFVDFCVSLVLIIIFSPLMFVCWLMIKLDDGGPALFSQVRIGRFGRPFKIYKFRSMRMDAESMGPALYSGDEDPRLTKAGSFLRRHHLDELPQLFNILFGDMAFVGYRPERKFYIDQILQHDHRYTYLYQIRPGVTSYATLKNGYTDTMEKMLKRLDFDLYYLRHRSWWFDIKILFSTFTNIVFGKIF